MLADLGAVAPSLIICVAFLVGVWMVLRHELAPKRRAERNSKSDQNDDDGS